MRRYIVLVIVLLFFFITAYAYGVEIIDITDIKPGMQGIGKTVFKGTKVEEFGVVVIDTIEDKSGEGYIFVKLTDRRFSEYGSIVAGMSGSPIYFNGKLAGALAYGWKFTKGPYGLIVPIRRMLSMKRNFFSWKGILNEASYLSVSGLGERGYEYLNKLFAGYGVKMLNVGFIKAKLFKNTPIIPGSAVSVDLTTGDLSISAIGTLTYRDKDFFLAFGHPIFTKGNIDFLLSSAYIFGIVPNMEFPFKLGAPIHVIGTAVQDRREGVGGYIGKYPKVISIIIEVKDIDNGKIGFFRVKSVQDEELFPPILLVSSLEGIDRAINRIGKGTSKVSITFNRGGESIVKLKDMYWSGEDIAAESLSGLKELVYELEDNPFKKINFDEVKVNIEITKHKNVGYIEDIVLDKDKYRPGELIKGDVTIRPFRKSPIIKKISIRIPDDFPPGSAYLLVRGGDVTLPEEIPEEQKNITDIKGFIKELTNREKNNSLVAELYAESFAEAIKKADKTKGGLTLEQFFGGLETKRTKRTFDMDMIIGDWVEKNVTIVRKESKR